MSDDTQAPPASNGEEGQAPQDEGQAPQDEGQAPQDEGQAPQNEGPHDEPSSAPAETPNPPAEPTAGEEGEADKEPAPEGQQSVGGQHPGFN